jgi:hypothetical protein
MGLLLKNYISGTLDGYIIMRDLCSGPMFMGGPIMYQGAHKHFKKIKVVTLYSSIWDIMIHMFCSRITSDEDEIGAMGVFKMYVHSVEAKSSFETLRFQPIDIWFPRARPMIPDNMRFYDGYCAMRLVHDIETNPGWSPFKTFCPYRRIGDQMHFDSFIENHLQNPWPIASIETCYVSEPDHHGYHGYNKIEIVWQSVSGDYNRVLILKCRDMSILPTRDTYLLSFHESFEMTYYFHYYDGRCVMKEARSYPGLPSLRLIHDIEANPGPPGRLSKRRNWTHSDSSFQNVFRFSSSRTLFHYRISHFSAFGVYETRCLFKNVDDKDSSVVVFYSNKEPVVDDFSRVISFECIAVAFFDRSSGLTRKHRYFVPQGASASLSIPITHLKNCEGDWWVDELPIRTKFPKSIRKEIYSFSLEVFFTHPRDHCVSSLNPQMNFVVDLAESVKSTLKTAATEMKMDHAHGIDPGSLEKITDILNKFQNIKMEHVHTHSFSAQFKNFFEENPKLLAVILSGALFFVIKSLYKPVLSTVLKAYDFVLVVIRDHVSPLFFQSLSKLKSWIAVRVSSEDVVEKDIDVSKAVPQMDFDISSMVDTIVLGVFGFFLSAIPADLDISGCVKKVGQLANFKRGLFEALSSVLAVITSTLQYIGDNLGLTCFRGVGIRNVKVKEAIVAADKHLADFRSKTMVLDAITHRNILSLLVKLHSVKVELGKNDPDFPALMSTTNALEGVLQAFAGAGRPFYRMAPFCVGIHGAPGTGKSDISDELMMILYSYTCTDEEWERFKENGYDNVYNWTSETNFRNGFRNQLFIKIDDFMQKNDTFETDPGLFEIIRIVNNNSYIVDAASIADKGNLYVSPAIVWINSNVNYFPPAVKSINSVQALSRRIYSWMWIVHPDYATAETAMLTEDKRLLDYSKLDPTKRFDYSAGYFKKLNTMTGQTEGPAVKFYSFMIGLIHHFKLHLQKQESGLEKKDELLRNVRRIAIDPSVHPSFECEFGSLEDLSSESEYESSEGSGEPLSPRTRRVTLSGSIDSVDEQTAVAHAVVHRMPVVKAVLHSIYKEMKAASKTGIVTLREYSSRVATYSRLQFEALDKELGPGNLVTAVASMTSVVGFIALAFSIYRLAAPSLDEEDSVAVQSGKMKFKRTRTLKSPAEKIAKLPQGAMFSSNTYDISSSLIRNNLYSIFMEGVNLGTCVAIQADVVLINTHYIENFLDRIDKGEPVVWTLSNDKEEFTFNLTDLFENESANVFRPDDRNEDITFIRVPWSHKKNIVDHFASTSDLSERHYVNACLLDFTSKKVAVATVVSWEIKRKSRFPEGSVEKKALEKATYPYDWVEIFVSGLYTEYGMCGIPLITADDTMQPKILGIHSAGTGAARKTFAMANAVSIEDVQRALSYFGTPLTQTAIKDFGPQAYLPDHLTVVGFVPPISQASRTKIFPSKLHGCFERIRSFSKLPAKLKNFTYEGVEIDPLSKTLDKIGISESRPTEANLSYIVESVSKKFYAPMKLSGKDLPVPRLLTFEEAVNGKGNLGCLPRSTAVGYPWNYQFKKKKDILGPADVPDFSTSEIKILRSHVERCLGKLALGPLDDEDSCFITFFKDEIRPSSKVFSGGTRTVNAESIHMSIISRILFGSVIDYAITTKIVNGLAIGVNPFSEWSVLTTILQNFSPLNFNGDFKTWEWTFYNWVYECNRRIVEKYYYNSTPAEVTLRRNFISTVSSPCVIFHRSKLPSDSDVVTPDDLNPLIPLPTRVKLAAECNKSSSRAWLVKILHCMVSGLSVTAFFNSLGDQVVITAGVLNSFFMEFGGLVKYNVPRDFEDVGDYFFAITMGDDNITSVKKELEVDQVLLSKSLAQLGFTYTDDDKSLEIVPYKTIDQCSFLKRRFVFDKKLGIWIAPIDLDSVYGPLYFRANGDDEIFFENIKNQVYELSLHSEETFATHVPILREQCVKHGYGMLDVQSHRQVRARSLTVEAVIR